MLRKLFLPILFCALLGTVVSCNSSSKDDEEVAYVQSSSATVTAFYINNNPKILDSLSNVFFSIDLVNAKIFNADSLPYGTKVSRLVPSITVASGAAAVEIKYYCPETGRDSLVNYLTNATDSIDFSHGPVQLTVTSQSGLVKREYEIKVNVHQVKADSLAWYSIESAPLPTAFTKVKDQCTACLAGTYYCLTTDGEQYSLATTQNPADPKWESLEVDFGFTPRVNSLRASQSALYMLSNTGELYTSADCRQWTSTGQTWHYIYGGYEDEILGCITDGTRTICSYPSGQTWPMPAEFPIDGPSAPASYSLSMGYAPQLVMLGGRRADDTLSSSAWGFDGQDWAEVSTKPLPTALQDVTMVPYMLVETPSSTWSPFDYPVLLAFGGRNKQGAINRDVYYSRDWGMTWRLAPELMQLPDMLPTFYGASAFTYTTLMHTSRSAMWSEIPVRRIPPFCSLVGLPFQGSRAVAPITEWECPAIYLFGGKDYDGNTLNTVWRGVIVQYTFVPKQ